MNSFLLRCRVKHERFSPTPHAFEYPVQTCLIDLDDLPELDATLRLFRHNGFQLTSLLDKDYLTEGPGPIREKLAELLRGQGMELEDADTVYLVTSPRYMNYVFNPVCFYWIFRGESLAACVAEVNNTFGEKHVYPLPGPGEAEGFPALYHAKKTFHVSPFFDRAGEYEFHFSDIRERLSVTVALFREGGKAFEASLTEEGERVPLSDAALLKTVLTRPFLTHLTFPRILWEAGKIHFGKKIGYNPKPEPMSDMTIRHDAKPTVKQRLARNIVLARLRGMNEGRLELKLPDGREMTFGQAGKGARIDVRDSQFYPEVLLHGDIGLGESYCDGLWDTPDLTQVILFFLHNRNLQTPAPGPVGATFSRTFGALQHLKHQFAPRNDEKGSRSNIAAHYDLSNELFSRFLDPTMMYSSAVFRTPCDRDEPLEDAQRRKNRLLADKIGIGPGDHVLEIGCGWGGFAEQIARERGCRITGVTVSQEQYDHACERIRAAGLEELVEIRFQDYRRITEQFDKIVSIEMLEAVGHDYHREFFRRVDELLAPSGLAAIQTITIQDAHYDRYRWSMDWIRKHIFPGGLLPSLSRICEVTSRRTSLVVQNVDAIGPHYANTLRRWREAFNANWEAIAEHGFDDYFRRTWNFYLSICEAGFTYGHINNLQIVLSRAEPAAVRGCCLDDC